MHNPDCDASITPCGSGEVRVLPCVGGNLNVCRRHFERELAWRRERNKHVASPYALPAWESLRELHDVYDALPEYEDSRDGAS